MNFAAGILFAVAAVAELGGVLLIVAGIRAARKHLDTPFVRVIDGRHPGSDSNLPPRTNGDPSEVFLLRAMERQGIAVVLLVIGIIAGTVGNFLTLS